MISAVGRDDDGSEILQLISNHGLDTTCIQKHESLPTSQVLVSLDEQGTASYTISEPCAWDAIGISPELITIVEQSDAIVFGSLVTRNSVSRQSLLQLLKHAPYKVFDVNLRAPHYNRQGLMQLMMHADLIKFNDEELQEICDYYKFESISMLDQIRFIAGQTNTDTICVTLGSKGALLYQDGNFYRNEGYVVDVRDTVGAGDSYLGTLVHNLLDGQDPQMALDMSCAVGSIVASKDGANPAISDADIENMMMQGSI